MTLAVKIAVEYIVWLDYVLDRWPSVKLLEFSENLDSIHLWNPRLSADHSLEKGVLLTVQFLTLFEFEEHRVL